MQSESSNTNSETNREKIEFFQGLKEQRSDAIVLLGIRLKALISRLPNSYLLPAEDIPELINDAILVTLKNLQNGSFQFQDYDPVTYSLAVARKLAANRLRKKKLTTSELNDHQPTPGFDAESYLIQKESEMAIGALLKDLGESCEQVIRLKYYDNLRDQEVVDQKITRYTTVDSLKNKRSQCLKKLAEMVKQKGLSITHFLK